MIARKLWLVFVCLVSTYSAFGQESIKSYHADITIKKSGELAVTETIVVSAQGKKIRNGIYRDFPTVYHPTSFTNSTVGLTVTGITRNGKKLPTNDIESLARGKRIYMRGGGKLAVPADYTFVLDYTVTRELGFFENHDELYWNILGGDWAFVAHKVSAVVHLPPGVDAHKVQLAGYTGYRGRRGQDFSTQIVNGSTIQFNGTRSFAPKQMFTIVVGWPKGFVDVPSLLQQWVWFLKDNLALLLLFLTLLLFIGYGVWGCITIKNNEPPKKVIPLFKPPKDFLPGMVNYFVKRKVTPGTLSADVVNMGVKGVLTIKQKEGWLWGKNYILEETGTPAGEFYYRHLLKEFFDGKSSITLGKKSQRNIQNAITSLKNDMKELVADQYFDNHDNFTIALAGIALVGGALGALSSFFLIGYVMPLPLIVFGALVFALLFLFYFFVSSYTKEGFVIRDQIEGFKMYLSAAEVERLKYTSTPPERTPELYETFLPYAMALGVEKQWTQQFTPIFKDLEKAGRPYRNTWYIGSGHFGSSSFATSFHSALSSSIGASAPGRSSGFGGGGGAGGGGGGGGGGGC